MALVNSTEKPRQSRSGGEADEKLQNSRASASRSFTILTTESHSTLWVRLAAQAAGWLPRKGEYHPDDFWHRCNNVEVEQVGPNYYEANASYVSLSFGDEDGDPTLQPAEIQWSHVITDEAVDQDVSGKPICTVLGESFDPPLTRPYADLFLTVTKNVSVFDPFVAQQFMHKVNADTFLGVFPPGTALIEAFHADSVITDDLSYWRRTIGVHFRCGAPNTTDAKAWFRRVRAEGFYIKGIAAGPQWKYRATDANGENSVNPVLHAVADGERIDNINDAEWYEFELFESVPFAPLNFI